MKKVRISKKNPNRILKAIDHSISPAKQKDHNHKLIRQSVKIEQLKNALQGNRVQQRENISIIHSHRYKPSSPDFGGRETERLYYNWKSQEKEKQDCLKSSCRKSKNLRDMSQKSTDKSPYLQKKYLNKSQKKLMLSSRNLLQNFQSKVMKRQLRTLRFNSHQQRTESIQKQKQKQLQVKKIKDSEYLLSQAKKFMQAGQSRKSMFILKPILSREPSNLQALYIAAVNQFNIGEYEKSAQYLHNIVKIKSDFHPNVYVMLCKNEIKLGKNYQEGLSKLQEAKKLFPNSQLLQFEKGLINLSAQKYQTALQCFKKAQAIAPKSISIQEKIILTYDKLGMHDQVLKQIKRAEKLFKLPEKYRVIKLKCLARMEKFSIIIEQHAQTSDPQILYYYALALYKTGNWTKSFLILQSSLTNSQDCTSSIKLMLLILCKSNDFYQAYHLIQRCQHLPVVHENLQREFLFVQAAISMMKRNISQGLQKFILAKDIQKRLESDQFFEFMQSTIEMFLGYGYFIVGNYEKAKLHYENQLNINKQQAFQGIHFNIQLNQSYLQFNKRDLKSSMKILQKLYQKYPHKLQPLFCLAVVYIKIYFVSIQKSDQLDKKQIPQINEKQKQEQTKSKSQRSNNEYKQYLIKAKQLFQSSLEMVSKQHSNIGANFFYHKSVLHAFLEQWREALISVDEAIDKSQQNYWRYYYLRAQILACIHNFSQAINDCTAAVNLKPSQPDPYILRSACFQIEGQGNYAFKDLQAYIALKPNDKQIHKFAGKLLFENGAFQDAISAFNHQPISEDISNQDVFMTKGKTYFLLGKFIEASQQMFRVHKINQNRSEVIFDGKMMVLVQKILSQPKNPQFLQQLQKVYENVTAYQKCQIFKKTELHTLKSICYFYSQQYSLAIQQFQCAIVTKQKTIMKQSLMEGSTREDEKDTRLFINQMNFNISICHLLMQDLANAQLYAQKMQFYSNDIFYQPYRKYITFLYSKPPLSQPIPQIIQIFPPRNKISNFLSQCSTNINNSTVILKPCIPFPKVEPPQIYPCFDVKLIKQFSMDRIERKCEAPWICKCDNTVKFTSRMERYSRLQIEQSATESSQREIDNSHISMDSIISRRSRVSQPKIVNKVHLGRFA